MASRKKPRTAKQKAATRRLVALNRKRRGPKRKSSKKANTSTKRKVKTMAKRRRSYRRKSKKSDSGIGLGDIAVAGYACEEFGVFDAGEEALGAVFGILGGELPTKQTAMDILTPIRNGMSLNSAVNVGGAAAMTGLIRKIIPGSGKKIGTLPKFIPLLGGKRINRF